MNKIATLLLLLLMAGAVWHMIHYYPLLSDTVASHFGLSGEPDGWTSKQSFVTLYGVLVAVMGGMFLAFAAVLPRLPDSLINMPNREYWLAPERRRQSLAVFSDWMLWLGNATVAFIIAVMHLSFLVNLGQRPGLGSEFFWMMGIYGLGTIVTSIWLWARFRKPSAD